MSGIRRVRGLKRGMRPWGRVLPAVRTRLALCLSLFLSLLLFSAVPAQAHTAFSGSEPADGEVLEEAPAQLKLRFSGKLEAAVSLHQVTLTGPDGAEIKPAALALDDGGKTLIAEIPPGLENGPYIAVFRVTAADGHPLEGAFSFDVSAPEPEQEQEPSPSPEAEPAPEPDSGHGQHGRAGRNEHADHGGHGGHSGHHGGGAAAEPMTLAERAFMALLFAGRIIYYAALLPLIGWALWSALRPPGAEHNAYWRRAGIWLLGAHLAAFIVHVALQWTELKGGGEASFLEVLRYTGTGQSWLFTGLLAAAGFPLLFRYRAVDGAWAVLVIAAATLRGHSSAFEPLLWARVFDGIHLAAASLWAGGLLAVALLFRRSGPKVRGFAMAFSNAALVTFAVLAVSGAASALIYMESPAELFRTAWGWLLAVKVVLALAVLPVAAVLRRKLRSTAGAADDKAAFLRWLRADLALLAGIVAVTGVLTHVSPMVERQKFHWHVMGETIHLTAEIHDLRKGRNELALKVWVPEGDDPPDVEVTIFVPGDPAERPFTLRKQHVEIEDWERFEGFDRYTYVGEGDIADPAEGVLTVRIRRNSASGGETLTYAKKLTSR